MPGTRKWRGVYAEENAFAICPDKMATLAAYDPGHGPHPWSRIKEYPPIHNCHGPAVTLPESGCEP